MAPWHTPFCVIDIHSAVCSSLTLFPGFELSKIAVVIPLHFKVENLGLAGCSGRYKREDTTADARELIFDARAVVLDERRMIVVAAVLLFLLDGGDDPPSGAARSDKVLVGHGEKVALLHRELSKSRCELYHILHESSHLVIALRLLGELRQVNILLTSQRMSDLHRRQRRGIRAQVAKD
ncbi:hypothetical protein M5K25_020148 [Dendrobium thyrsiflorum]|uniref:Uncharacterized protein n=1 Tax=Dendrobium thyrsiflorum TaxID=117978 RepID=A0ABD0U9A7_DENTH